MRAVERSVQKMRWRLAGLTMLRWIVEMPALSCRLDRGVIRIGRRLAYAGGRRTFVMNTLPKPRTVARWVSTNPSR